MPDRRCLSVLVIGMLLAACSPVPQTPPVTPATEPVRLTIALDPFTGWLEPVVAACVAQVPGLELMRLDGEPQAADLWFQYGQPAAENRFNAWLTDDPLTLVTHPGSQVTELNASMVASIFTGEITAWADVQSGQSGEILLIGYPANTPAWRSFAAGLALSAPPASALRLAASPAEVREFVTGQPGSLGVLPARWVDETLQVVEIHDPANPPLLSQPVVVSADQEPTGAARDWLLCIQDILAPSR